MFVIVYMSYKLNTLKAKARSHAMDFEFAM